VQIAKYTNNDNPSINDFVEYLEVIKRGRKWKY
jgi:hypothetical protein